MVFRAYLRQIMSNKDRNNRDCSTHGLLLCCDWSSRHPTIICSTAKNRSSFSVISVGNCRRLQLLCQYHMHRSEI